MARFYFLGFYFFLPVVFARVLSKIWHVQKTIKNSFRLRNKIDNVKQPAALSYENTHVVYRIFNIFTSWRLTVPSSKDLKLFFTDKTKTTRVCVCGKCNISCNFAHLAAINSLRNPGDSAAFVTGGRNPPPPPFHREILFKTCINASNWARRSPRDLSSGS